MRKFFEKSWIPYVFPFLIILICSEAALFIPQWRYQLLILGSIIAATLIYLWRDRVLHDAIPSNTVVQTLVGVGAGLFLAMLWYFLIHAGDSPPEPLKIGELWSGARKYVITTLTTVAFAVIIPVVSELFWRSFLLRYFIAPDFKSIPLGTFNLFSFIMVVVLGALPTSNYSAYLLVSGILYTGITLWSKNVYCSTIAHVVANSCIMGLALYFGIAFY
ncbi:MAG: CAAX prenyl protease-related protein [Geobacteraceae bacterium]|nr:CAAX prenyl protease-related protein [Geobacteraceae bacterium]